MRQWKESAIDWFLRLRRDVFFSTRLKLILFHILSIVVIVYITMQLITAIQETTLRAVIELLQQSLRGELPRSDILDIAASRVDDTIRYVFLIIIGTAILTAIIASSIALRPLRNTLEMRRRFIASIAHELRTPLAIMRTENELAKLEHDGQESVKQVFTENIVEIDHMTEILNSLLLFNRVDTVESINFEDVNLARVLETVWKRLKEFANRKGVDFQLERRELPPIYGNATALEQVFYNIAKNALNYTKRPGTVIISVTDVSEEEVMVSISDTGIGITQVDLPHIFEPFYRARSGQDQWRGTGLGLSLVFEIVKLHNGKIRVESTERVGTTVFVAIPRRPVGAAVKRAMRPGSASYDFSVKSDS